MNIDPNCPDFPIAAHQYPNGTFNYGCDGLTIRAEIASRIIAGLAANKLLASAAADWGPAHFAKASVQMADALIAELNLPTNQSTTNQPQ